MLVAIIGPEDSIVDCLKIAKEYPWLSIKAFPYETEDETDELVKSLQNDFSVILFTGPIPYLRTKDMPELMNCKCLYVPFNSNGLYKALFQARNISDFSHVSIDTIKKSEVSLVYEELGLKITPDHILEYNHAITTNEFVGFHKALYEQGKTEMAFTCLRSCYLALKKMGIPVIRIFPLGSDIRESFEKTQLVSESLWNKGLQITVGVMAVDGYHEWAKVKGIHEAQALNLRLTQFILQYVKDVDGHFIHTSPGEFLFFTTRTLMENSTNQFSHPPQILKSFSLSEQLTVSIGIGIGGTASLSANHARIALQQAQQYGGNTCFVVNEQHQIIGPLGNEQNSIIDLRTTDDLQLEAAKKTGLSAATLNRLLNAVKQSGREFTANEVASFLSMTLRSSRRLLSYLEKASIIEIVGQESLHSRGKPRRVYKLTPGRVDE
jgi:hypothetical protein